MASPKDICTYTFQSCWNFRSSIHNEICSWLAWFLLWWAYFAYFEESYNGFLWVKWFWYHSILEIYIVLYTKGVSPWELWLLDDPVFCNHIFPSCILSDLCFVEMVIILVTCCIERMDFICCHFGSTFSFHYCSIFVPSLVLFLSTTFWFIVLLGSL